MLHHLCHNYKNVIAEHISISVGYIWPGKLNTTLDCIKRFARDLLEIEKGNNFKCNE